MKIPVLNRRFNPVVDRFITTDLTLQAIISQTAPSPPPMESAIVRLCDCLDGRLLARDAIAAAKAVPLKGQDPELTILLLTRWAELAARLSNPSEAETLLHQARALLSGKSHPEIVAAVHFAMCVLEEARGNQMERETLLNRIAAELPEHSPRRKFYLWELGFLLARQGRGADFKTQMHQLTWQTGERFPLEQLDRLHFIDAVETGQIRIAAERMSAIGTASPTTDRRLYREYQQLLNLMHQYGRGLPRPSLPRPSLPRPGTAGQTTDPNANSEHTTPDARRPTPGNADPGTKNVVPPANAPVWIQTLHHLLEGDAPGALQLARLEAKRALVSIFGTGFGAFNLIRAELASGNADAAHRLLEMRRSRGNAHYLDGVFTARCARLANRPQEAAERFREAQAAAEHYGATGRLEFELRLALEMPDRTGEACLAQAGLAPSAPPPAGRIHPGSPPAPAPAHLTPRLKARPSKTPPPAADASVRPAPAPPVIIGHSPAILQLRDTIAQMATLDTLVLITGETGTGKELVAAALHRQSPRAIHPFIAINCSAISETLLESELFGHERGSFTGADRTTRGLFEDAGEGTLLLDEIGDVTPRLQAVLLRVLETGEIRAIGSSRSRQIHCRILAATNARLEQRVADGRFRQDLLYRLQRLAIHIPPLRERREDIMALARHFLDEGRPVGTHATVSAAFSEAVRNHDWPGNVRELRNVIERMRLTHSDKLAYNDTDLDIRRPGSKSPRPETDPPPTADGPPASPLPPASATGAQTRPRPGYLEDDGVSGYLQSGHSPLRRAARLKTLFREHRRLTRAEVTHLLDVSPNTATKYLQSLCKEGFIHLVDPSASSRSRYFELADTDQATASPPD